MHYGDDENVILSRLLLPGERPILFRWCFRLYRTIYVWWRSGGGGIKMHAADINTFPNVGRGFINFCPELDRLQTRPFESPRGWHRYLDLPRTFINTVKYLFLVLKLPVRRWTNQSSVNRFFSRICVRRPQPRVPAPPYVFAGRVIYRRRFRHEPPLKLILVNCK